MPLMELTRHVGRGTMAEYIIMILMRTALHTTRETDGYKLGSLLTSYLYLRLRKYICVTHLQDNDRVQDTCKPDHDMKNRSSSWSSEPLVGYSRGHQLRMRLVLVQLGLTACSSSG